MTTKKNKGSPYRDRWRYYCVILGLLLGVFGLVYRMVDLTVVERPFLQAQGKARTVRTIELPAYRGMIMDRNGHPLAVSSPADSIWINPQEVDLEDKHWLKASELLNENFATIKARVEKNSRRGFLYLKRQLTPHLAKQIQALSIKGLYVQEEYRRFYPEGEVTAHVIGFTDIDENGQEGIELAYDDWLRGIPGKRMVIKDRLGKVVQIIDDVQQARPGEDIELSIDHRIQYIAYRELKKAVKKNQANSGSIVILDVKSGEILSMVNYPSYNPNGPRKAANDGRYRNRAMTDVFEPGSTIKTMSVVNVLQHQIATPETLIDTNPGWMTLNGRVVREIQHHNYGVITLTQVLQKSSNVGIAKITLQTPPNSLWHLLKKLGFGQITAVQFPGEVAGSMVLPHRWSDFTLSTLSFGYGFSSTALQLAQAYAVLAAEGVKRPVSIIKVTKAPQGERIIDKEIAKNVNVMLELVVQGKEGTAKKAQIPGYRVMGKTGTVRMISPNGGYDKNRHVSFFVGALPASDPRLVAVVVINDPTAGQYYGGAVAAPLFAEVLGPAARLLNIAPDMIGDDANG